MVQAIWGNLESLNHVYPPIIMYYVVFGGYLGKPGISILSEDKVYSGEIEMTTNTQKVSILEMVALVGKDGYESGAVEQVAKAFETGKRRGVSAIRNATIADLPNGKQEGDDIRIEGMLQSLVDGPKGHALAAACAVLNLGSATSDEHASE